MYTNYCHNTLSTLFGSDYVNAIKTPTTINPMLKAAIDKAYAESTNKSSCKKLITKYAKLTSSGIKECNYCQELLSKFK